MTRFGLNDVLAADCCVPDCDAAAIEDGPFPICAGHYIKVVRHWHATVQGNGYTRDLYGTYEVPLEREPPPGLVEQVIYIIRFGQAVKVGITANLARRLGELPHDEVLAVFPGTLADEADLHRRLARHRHSGEWFHYNDHVRDMLADLVPSPR